MNFCRSNNCTHCCIEADVPLLQEDIDHLMAYGYFDVYFSDDYHGTKIIRKVGGKCVFFQDGKCEVEDARPKRCRHQEVAYDHGSKSVTPLDTCLYKSQIQLSQVKREYMEDLINKLIKEIELRIHYNPQGAAIGRVNGKLTVIK